MPTYKYDEEILFILVETLFYEKNESAALSIIAYILQRLSTRSIHHK